MALIDQHVAAFKTRRALRGVALTHKGQAFTGVVVSPRRSDVRWLRLQPGDQFVEVHALVEDFPGGVPKRGEAFESATQRFRIGRVLPRPGSPLVRFECGSVTSLT